MELACEGTECYCSDVVAVKAQELVDTITGFAPDIDDDARNRVCLRELRSLGRRLEIWLWENSEGDKESVADAMTTLARAYLDSASADSARRCTCRSPMCIAVRVQASYSIDAHLADLLGYVPGEEPCLLARARHVACIADQLVGLLCEINEIH